MGDIYNGGGVWSVKMAAHLATMIGASMLFVRIGETSSQQICTLQEMHVEAFGRFCPYTRY